MITDKRRLKRVETENGISSCPYCLSAQFISWGSYKSRKRYKCSGCLKTFTKAINEPLRYVKKVEEFVKVSEFLLSRQKMPTLVELREKFGICNQTAHEWRQKIMKSIDSHTDSFKGIVEVDELFFPHSLKGRNNIPNPRKRGTDFTYRGDNDYQVKVVVAYDRGGNLEMNKVAMGRLSKKDFDAVLGHKIDKKAVITSDAHRSIKAFTRDRGIKHKSFKAKSHSTEGIYHVNNINNIAGRFNKIWSDSKGLSTKYLQNYLNWFVYGELKRKGLELPKVIDNWNGFINEEKEYKEFMKEHSRISYIRMSKKYWKNMECV